jgi:hypothetical protein
MIAPDGVEIRYTEVAMADGVSPTCVLTVLEPRMAVCRFRVGTLIPAWVLRSPWFSVTRTEHELSIVCVEALASSEVVAERGFRLIEVEGPLPFTAVGVLARLTSVLAEAGVPVLAVSTYDTDYLLVHEARLATAVEALIRAGYEVGER